MSNYSAAQKFPNHTGARPRDGTLSLIGFCYTWHLSVSPVVEFGVSDVLQSNQNIISFEILAQELRALFSSTKTCILYEMILSSPKRNMTWTAVFVEIDIAFVRF